VLDLRGIVSRSDIIILLPLPAVQNGQGPGAKISRITTGNSTPHSVD
jgi:hypothetical protein